MNKKKLFRWWAAISGCAVVAGTIAFISDHPVAAELRQEARQSAATKRGLQPGDVDVNSSRAYIHVEKTGFGHEHAVVGRVKAGEIHLGAARDAGKIVFDMSTFTADTLEARNYIGLKGATSAATQKQVNANMLGKDVLNVKAYPTATFEIASAVPLKPAGTDGNPRYQLKGEFTLHGVKRALKLDVDAEQKDDRIRLSGGFAVLQSSFGITPYSTAFGTIGVADTLTIYGTIDVVAKGDGVKSISNRR